MGWHFPLWIEIACTIVLIIIAILLIRGLYRNYLINLFSRRKTVRAMLISKVEEEYYEPKAYMNSSGIKSPTSGLGTGKRGIAYRLYFTVEQKTIELDVDRATFQTLPETGVGQLEYKGNIYYSFVLEK